MSIVLQDGLGLLVRDIGVMIFAILMTVWLARIMKADKNISLLLGVGTGICGAAAIAAIAPIIKAKDEDTAISVGIIALVGTIFSISYIILRPFVPLRDLEYGTWAGISLHEIAHVVCCSTMGRRCTSYRLTSKIRPSVFTYSTVPSFHVHHDKEGI